MAVELAISIELHLRMDSPLMQEHTLSAMLSIRNATYMLVYFTGGDVVVTSQPHI